MPLKNILLYKDTPLPSRIVRCNEYTLCTQTNNVSHVTNPTISSTTIRKDTIIVPAGGYVRVQFIANNPGYWFLHCHLEPHQVEGMSVLID